MRSTLVVVALCVLVGGVRSEGDDIFLGEKYKAGFVEFENGDDIFYWLFKAREEKVTEPLTVWLTGGPGCSS